MQFLAIIVTALVVQSRGSAVAATPLIYPFSNEALRPERAGCRDRFGAG